MGLISCSEEVEQGCSEEVEQPAKPQVTVKLLPYMPDYMDAAMTRAWTPPEGYSLVAGSENKSIGIFFTKDGEDPKKGYFVYQRSEDKWLTSVEIGSADTYYLYGYYPHTSNISSSIAPGAESKYSNGAVMSINNLPTVTTNDFCVVVGAKNGKDDYNADPAVSYEVENLANGDFEYRAEATGEGGGSNYVFLLFDHLYSALQIRFKVDAEYSTLRTIKLKSLQLQTYTESGVNKKRCNATVTLEKTTGLANVVFAGRGEDESPTTFYEPDEPVTLTTSYSDYKCCFMPQGVTKLALISTYDIYDNNPSEGHPEGNLIRKNQTARNEIDMSKLETRLTAQKGTRYTINLTILPTYLYMMSDDDLINPTIEE